MRRCQVMDCGRAGDYPHRTRVTSARRTSTRTQWFCAEHWRIRAGGVTSQQCTVCRRLGRACLAHAVERR
jgi:hypothetical protein